ncbi:MAG: hypothetical protein HQK55_06020 [Deltaproteobacteria bacterium]|nr:hypothetical protein [Deltaproteobacteria bacterium]
MAKPIDFILEHWQAIKAEFDRQGNVATTYRTMLHSLPGLDQIAEATFKQYVNVVLAVVERINKDKQYELEAVKQELNNAMSRIAELEEIVSNSKLNIVKQNEAKPADGHLQKIGSWQVILSGGYYRAFRKIEGTVHAVYIGKNFNLDAAKQKINNYELKHSLADKQS